MVSATRFGRSCVAARQAPPPSVTALLKRSEQP